MTQKTEEVDDLRVRRTRKMLQEALIELTVEKGFAAVTVRDITERAMVNRSTFYRHYVDKYDLLEQYMTSLGEMVGDAAVAAEKASPTTSEKVPSGLLVLVKHVQEYADFYRIMLGQNGDPLFTLRFRKMSEDRFRYVFALLGGETDPNAPPIDMKLHYISCAAVGAILWWLENDQPCAPEQLAVWIGSMNMTSAGLKKG